MRLERLVLELHDYLDQAEAAAYTEQPAPATPFMWRLYRLWREWGVSPLELLEWPTGLIEGFQVFDIVERQRSPGTGRNLPVEVGDASWPVSPAGFQGRSRRHDITGILTCPRVQSAQLFHDEKKIYLCFWRPSNVWNYRYNFALQAIQELLQFTLILCHTDIESVNPVFHFNISYF